MARRLLVVVVAVLAMAALMGACGRESRDPFARPERAVGGAVMESSSGRLNIGLFVIAAAVALLWWAGKLETRLGVGLAVMGFLLMVVLALQQLLAAWPAAFLFLAFLAYLMAQDE